MRSAIALERNRQGCVGDAETPAASRHFRSFKIAAPVACAPLTMVGVPDREEAGGIPRHPAIMVRHHLSAIRVEPMPGCDSQ
jgi:hypothetical protein